MNLSLNDDLDIPALASQFAKNKRVQIKNVLSQASADRVYRCLTEETEWVVGYKDGEKSLITTEQAISSMSPTERQEFMEKLSGQAAHDFQFLYYCFPLDDERLKKFYADHFLYRVYDFIRSEVTLKFIREVSGIKEIVGANAQATWYRSNNFLTRHNDFEPVTSRRVAYVMNFSKDWNTDWGGYLQFYDQDGNIEEGYMPRFNSLNLFQTPMDHSVSYVAPFCDGKRLGITGWFRDAVV
ncbi:MAG: 2OG-Fe(II) oxygenase family protein [Sphingomonadales bacterium]